MKVFSDVLFFPRGNSACLPTAGFHEFYRGDDDVLRHSINGRLVAEVPREGWERYCEDWPSAKNVCTDIQVETGQG